MIIALCGLPRVGKDTFANFIKEHYNNVETYAFAEPIKQMCCAAFGWDRSLFDSKEKDELDPFWNVVPREMLEYVGTTVMRGHIRKKFSLFDKAISENIWVKRFEKFYLEHRNKTIIITDLRFATEYNYLKSIENTNIILIERPNFDIDQTRWYDIKSMNYDCVLHNDVENDLGHYQSKVFELYDLLKRK